MTNGEVNSGRGSDRERSTKSRLSQRQVPEGRPTGSFISYADAQAAVDSLSDHDEFPVSDLTIVSVDLMQVERVVGRLTWSKVLGGDALYRLWMGLFFGLVLGLFQGDWVNPLIVSLGMGAISGVVLAVVSYAIQNDKRDFSTTTGIVARRRDVLCNPRNAECARDLLAQRASDGSRGQAVASIVVKRCLPEAEPTVTCRGAGSTPKTPR